MKYFTSISLIAIMLMLAFTIVTPIISLHSEYSEREKTDFDSELNKIYIRLQSLGYSDEEFQVLNSSFEEEIYREPQFLLLKLYNKVVPFGVFEKIMEEGLYNIEHMGLSSEEVVVISSLYRLRLHRELYG